MLENKKGERKQTVVHITMTENLFLILMRSIQRE